MDSVGRFDGPAQSLDIPERQLQPHRYSDQVSGSSWRTFIVIKSILFRFYMCDFRVQQLTFRSDYSSS
jgi:hypothetical protein